MSETITPETTESNTPAQPAIVEAATVEANSGETTATSDQATAEKVTEPTVEPTVETPKLSKSEAEYADFEVPKERAEFIRAQLQSLRDLEVMENFRVLAKELGVETAEIDEDGTTQLPGFTKKGDNPLVFAAPVGHPSEGLAIALQNTDLKLMFNKELLLEISFLPKDDEYAVFYMDESRIDDLNKWIESLGDFVSAAKAKKAERKAKWKGRFKKKESNYCLRRFTE